MSSSSGQVMATPKSRPTLSCHSVLAALSTCLVLLFLLTLPGSPLHYKSSFHLQQRDTFMTNPYFLKAPALPATSDNDEQSLRSWMARISDKTRITDVNMPGTHDSAARFGGDTYACQSLSLSDQLIAGVRFFDIRLALRSGELECQHGRVFQNLHFANVLDTMSAFLETHPSETVLIKIQQEHTRYAAEDFGALVTSSLSSYPVFKAAQPITTDSVPTMAELRGTMLIVPRFFDVAFNTISYEATTAQDEFQVDLMTKQNAIVAFHSAITTGSPLPGTKSAAVARNQTSNTKRERGLTKAQKITSAQGQDLDLLWYINYFSLHNNVNSPQAAAFVLNPIIETLLNPKSIAAPSRVTKRSTKSTVFGVVMMDFIAIDSSKLIINSNFP